MTKHKKSIFKPIPAPKEPPKEENKDVVVQTEININIEQKEDGCLSCFKSLLSAFKK